MTPKLLHRFLVGAAVLSTVSPAWSVNGAGSLFVAGVPNTPTHWDIPIGMPTTAEIRGVLASEVGGSLPATLTVIVKSSVSGNTSVVATQIGASADYTFTYTPPAVANGDGFDACGTTIVAYVEDGRNSNNDFCDDGLKNGSANAASGFRFVYASGTPIPCTIGIETAPWSGVKRIYR